MKSESCTITRKGQVTIPIRLRRAFRLSEGDRILFREEKGKIIIEPVENRIEAAFGLVKAKKSVSLAEMDEAVKQRARS